jgi:hypothetical protein
MMILEAQLCLFIWKQLDRKQDRLKRVARKEHTHTHRVRERERERRKEEERKRERE